MTLYSTRKHTGLFGNTIRHCSVEKLNLLKWILIWIFITPPLIRCAFPKGSIIYWGGRRKPRLKQLFATFLRNKNIFASSLWKVIRCRKCDKIVQKTLLLAILKGLLISRSAGKRQNNLLDTVQHLQLVKSNLIRAKIESPPVYTDRFLDSIRGKMMCKQKSIS